MSGEAGGVIIGGIVVAALLPVVVTGAAALGLAYGAIRLGSYLAKEGARYAHDRHVEKQLAVERCSAELNAVYEQMRSVVGETSARQLEAQRALGQRLEKIGHEVEELKERHPSTQALESKITEANDSLRRELSERSRAERRRIIDEGKQRMAQCAAVIDKSAHERDAATDWISRTESAAAAQKAAAEQMLKDAEASVEMLRGMAAGSADRQFRNDVRKMEQTLFKAQSFADSGAYQTAFGTARTVVRSSALLASEQTAAKMEADAMALELCARLAGLEERMEKQRFITIEDPSRSEKRQERMDLDRFSQGHYCRLLSELRQMRGKVETDSASCEEMDRLTEQLDEVLEPRVDEVIGEAKGHLLSFLERRHVLEIVANYMKQQNYTMDWATPVGADLTQMLVVHFTQNHTGNEVSMTLDADADVEQIRNMAMEILTFYPDGRPVSEAEKQNLRSGLSKALQEAGLGGQFGCKSRVNMPSDRRDYADKKKVQMMPAEQILNNSEE